MFPTISDSLNLSFVQMPSTGTPVPAKTGAEATKPSAKAVTQEKMSDVIHRFLRNTEF